MVERRESSENAPLPKCLKGGEEHCCGCRGFKSSKYNQLRQIFMIHLLLPLHKVAKSFSTSCSNHVFHLASQKKGIVGYIQVV